MQRRQLLAALAAPVFVPHARAADEPRFALGVASGTPRPAGVVLWTRLTGAALPAEVPVRWEVAHDEAFTRIAARGDEIASAADAHSVHAEAGGLEPARGYFYRFTALGQQSATGRTRTAPAPDAAVAKLDFTVASCQRWDHGHYAAWRDVAADAPDLVLFMGDYIYEYASEGDALPRRHEGGRVRTLAQYRARYAQYRSDPHLQRAHAACPWLVIRDDHEVENDYAGLQGNRLQPDFAAERAAAYQAWWEHMPVPKAARPQAGALPGYEALDWGRLARIHAVDGRQWRAPQVCNTPGRGGSRTVARAECAELADPARSLLGAAQERALAEGWDLQRPWNLLMQPTLMARFGIDRVWNDGWDGYAPARRRLLDTVAQRRVPGAVMLGGDVHTTYVADLKPDFDDPKSPVVASEFCGTSISSESGFPQARLDRLPAEQPHFKLARTTHRGTLRATLAPGRLEVAERAVRDVLDAASPVDTLTRWAVDAARPGPQRA